MWVTERLAQYATEKRCMKWNNMHILIMLIQLCPDSWSILSCVCRYSPVNGPSLPHISPLVHFVPVNSLLCLSFWFIPLPPSVCPLYHSWWFILFRVCPFMRQSLVHFVPCMPQFLVHFVPCMPQFLVHFVPCMPQFLIHFATCIPAVP